MSEKIQILLQKFKSLDFFSVPFQPAISDNKVFYHKSYIGACTSFILMVVSMIYGIQQFILWQNWQLVPKVTQQYTIISEAEKLMTQTINVEINTKGWYYDESIDDYLSIDPFDPQNIVLLPLVYSILDDWDGEGSFGNYGKYYNNGTLNLNLTILADDEIQVVFISCNTKYLIEGQQCASQDIVDQYFKQFGNEIYVKMIFSQISPDNFEQQTFYRNYGILIEEAFCMTEIVYLQRTKYDMDFQFLFDGSTYLYLYSDATDQTQLSSQYVCSKTYLPQTYGLLWIVQQNNMGLIKMRYPKIGEVFANIGSIISFLFLIKYVIVAMNFNQLRDSTLDKIADSYFSDLANCQITRKWYGKIKSISLKGKEIEQKSYHAFREKMRQHFGCKLNYFNLIYEVSRIQMILCSLQSKKQLLKSHLVGIPMQMKLDQKQKLYKIINLQGSSSKFQSQQIEDTEEQVYILKSEDANILSYQQKQFCLEEQNLIKESQQQDYDFYDLNKIPFITSHKIDVTQKL